MRLLFAFFIVATLIVTACGSQKKEKKSQVQPSQKGAWLPAPEYRSKSKVAIQLNDSAAALQIRAMQDPTLDPVDRLALIETAFKLLNEALKLDTEYRLAMSNLAAIYLEKRDTTKALELMKRRLELEPDMAEGWQAVGVFTDMLGDSILANTYYQKSIDIFNRRLKMGKEYTLPEDLIYYYDNWSGKAFSLLLMGQTKAAHQSIQALLDEAAVILGPDAETYAAMLNKDRWKLLKEMKGEQY